MMAEVVFFRERLTEEVFFFPFLFPPLKNGDGVRAPFE